MTHQREPSFEAYFGALIVLLCLLAAALLGLFALYRSVSDRSSVGPAAMTTSWSSSSGAC